MSAEKLSIGKVTARCFANLKNACRGDQIARDAITTALHYLRRDMLSVREKNIYDDCRERVRA